MLKGRIVPTAGPPLADNEPPALCNPRNGKHGKPL